MRAKTFNKKNHEVMLRSLLAYKEHIETKKRFLVGYGEVFKIPNDLMRRNLRKYDSIISSIDVIEQTAVFKNH